MEIWVVRHGETEWSRDKKHTGRTDVPLTAHGEEEARALGRALGGHPFGRVLCSPLQRARETARLAGFGDPEILDLLVEFDYGEYEGRTTQEIRQKRPGWDLWSDGCPGGETATDVARRMDEVLTLVGEPDDDILVFAHGHCLRVLAARYLSLDREDARLFGLDAGSLSVLGHERETRVIRSWNLTPRL